MGVLMQSALARKPGVVHSKVYLNVPQSSPAPSANCVVLRVSPK